MLGRILGWFAALPFRRIFQTIDHSVSEETERKRLKLDAAKHIATTQVEALATTSGFKWWHPQFIIGYCVAFYVFKIVVWDSALGLGSTPDPGANVTSIVQTVIAFFFPSAAAVAGVSIIANVIRRR